MGFFEDQFSEAATTSLASHTPNVGTSWSLLWDSSAGARVLQVLSTGRVRCSGNSGDTGLMYVANATYPTANYEVEATWLGTFSAITPIYLLARVQDQENMYAVRLVTGTNGAQLYKKVSGTWSTLGSAVTIAAGSVVKLSVNGTAIKVYDDGIEVVSVTDSSITAAGKAGIAHGGAAELVASTDDTRAYEMLDTFYVTDLGSGGPTNYTVAPAAVATSAPTVQAMALATNAVTAAGSVATAAPTLGAPALTTNVPLAAGAIATTAPTVGTPALTTDAAAVASGIAAGAVTVGAAALTTETLLAAAAIATGAPTVAAPAIVDDQAVGDDYPAAAASVATGAPSVGAPALTTDAVVAGAGIATGAPIVGAAALTTNVTTAAAGVSTGAPSIGAPALDTQEGVTDYAVAAPALALGAVQIGAPAFTTNAELVMYELALGAIAIGAPTVAAGDVVLLPAEVLTVGAQSRAITAGALAAAAVGAQSRTTVTRASASVTVPAQSRRLTV